MTKGEYEIGPYAFPRAVCAIAAVMMAAILIKQGKLAAKGLLKGYDSNTEPPTYRMMALIVGACMLYVWAMPRIGFIIASLILLVALLLIGGVRKPVTILLVSLGLFLVAFVFFCLLMKLQLPRGKGIFKTFSLMFY